jgi:uncharacterized protein (TIGR01777 family)
MKILISGSTGMIGTALIVALRKDGHTIARLARPGTHRPSGADNWVRWDPPAGEFDAAAAEGVDAVVNLAGASIGEGRWSEKRKVLLRTSRVDATRHLIGALANLKRPPRVFISASAVGFYGDRGDEELTEQSAPGRDFLASLCCDWEAEAQHAEQFGARVVLPRFGIILAKQGGALPRMLTPFRMGVGGRLGSGRQWMSWISLDDMVGILRHALSSESSRGPVNTVAPNPVRNAEFTATLAHALHRPAIFPAPAFALKLALGEMAGPLLLSSQRVIPVILEQAGYRFQHSHLDSALANALASAKSA